MKQFAELTKRLKRQRTALLVGVILNAVAMPSWAQEADAPAATVDIAGHSVPVEAGGLYQRFHSNPPLSVIAAEAPDIDLSWFRGLQKTKVDMGFESYSPNFYYRNSRVTAVFTADLDRLRELMPTEVLGQVQPLQIWPGRGLVAFTAYAYHYCDNKSKLYSAGTQPTRFCQWTFLRLRGASNGDVRAHSSRTPLPGAQA